MGEPTQPDPVMLIVAAFSGQQPAITWATEQLELRYGPVAIESPLFDFVETDYYQATMGPELKKQFFGFCQLIDPSAIAGIKLETNQLESSYSRLRSTDLRSPASCPNGAQAPGRPLNIDPGYLSAGKLVLATTKNQAQRNYLGQGIYAEVTLRYQQEQFVPWPWTYANYGREDYREFFRKARVVYLRLLKNVLT